ncbi:MAG: carboxypeptidase regulatory-like domain-containing protein [Acidobacteriota bacterium]|nr:carboxypeptidase regulatory-like domain-containing protein [Acidobacteriota bacterium]
MAVPLYGAAPGTVTGVVRDSAGEPQIGALVQLLQPDFSVVVASYTDAKGRFVFSNIAPGRYQLKAIATSFLPALRDGVRVRRGTVVNLTLNTLYEVMQWLPAQPKAANASSDDWAWTLRSAANRPLLRWLEDGPLLVVSDGSGGRPRLKARLMATGQAGTFGESGERITAAMQDTPSDSRELLARVDFAPGTDGGMESMLGFSQDLGFAGSVQSLAAMAIHPEIDSAASEGLDEAAFQSAETIRLGPDVTAKVGAAQVLARFAQDNAGTLVETLPFASIEFNIGSSTVAYRMATMTSPSMTADASQTAYWLPTLVTRDGNLAVEKGLHQEIGWQRQTDTSGMSVVFFNDDLENPALEAAPSGHAPVSAQALYDQTSGLMRVAGPNFSAPGMMASFERTLPGGKRVRFQYANGSTLVLPALQRSVPLSQLLAAAHPRRVQTYALSLSGTLDGTNTHWSATYRWQPADTVTPVAPFAGDALEPYLAIRLRQPIRERAEGGGGIDAVLDVSNLLAEGYRPYVLPDGSTLIFAQGQRAIGAGIVFTF